MRRIEFRKKNGISKGQNEVTVACIYEKYIQENYRVGRVGEIKEEESKIILSSTSYVPDIELPVLYTLFQLMLTILKYGLLVPQQT